MARATKQNVTKAAPLASVTSPVTAINVGSKLSHGDCWHANPFHCIYLGRISGKRAAKRAAPAMIEVMAQA